MNTSDFQERVNILRAHHEELLSRKNEPLAWGNGIYDKYKYPIITAEHVPLEWKYDFNEQDNPYLMQRIMCNATLNSGAIKWNGKYMLVVRVEGADRKSYFCCGRESQRNRQFPFLARTHHHARRCGACHKHLRHAYYTTRGRMDLWRVLCRAS